jgi:hypothetical protein
LAGEDPVLKKKRVLRFTRLGSVEPMKEREARSRSELDPRLREDDDA